jgi:hypothetical protein
MDLQLQTRVCNRHSTENLYANEQSTHLCKVLASQYSSTFFFILTLRFQGVKCKVGLVLNAMKTYGEMDV